MDSYLNDSFLTYKHFYFTIKTPIKLVGFLFIYLFIYLLWRLYQIIFTQGFLILFFYCVIAATNFSRCCRWLRFAAQ